jgi:hypothetical protein
LLARDSDLLRLPGVGGGGYKEGTDEARRARHARTTRATAMHGRATAAILLGVALLLIGNLLFRAFEPRKPAHAPSPSPSWQAARPPPSSPPLVLYVFATFTDGATLGEGLHILVSSDGLAWRTLQGALPPLAAPSTRVTLSLRSTCAGDPILLPQGRLGTVFRDPSIVWHGGWFHLAFTTELCVGLQR